jgi:hypothetical protein
MVTSAKVAGVAEESEVILVLEVIDVNELGDVDVSEVIILQESEFERELSRTFERELLLLF